MSTNKHKRKRATDKKRDRGKLATGTSAAAPQMRVPENLIDKLALPATYKEQIARYFDWADMSARPPLSGPLGTDATLRGLRRIRAFSDWAIYDLTSPRGSSVAGSELGIEKMSEPPPSEWLQSFVRKANRQIDLVDDHHEKNRVADLRRIVTAHIVVHAAAWVPVRAGSVLLPIDAEAMVRGILDAAVELAQTLSPVLAERLTANSEKVREALLGIALPGGRRTAVFVLTRVLDGKAIGRSTAQKRREVERGFDDWVERRTAKKRP